MRNALLTSILLAGSALAASPALADDAPAAPAAPASAFTITGGADVSSQYRFRGISQSDNQPVFQGTFTITHASGFYLSTWGSSASSGNTAVNIGGTEIDVYGGYSKTIAGFTLDGGLYGYIYPGSGKVYGVNENYYEVYGDVSKAYGPVTAKLGVNWAPKQTIFKTGGAANFEPTHYNVYVFGELGFALPSLPLSFHSHVGHTAGGFDYFFGNKPKEYIDYTVGATYKWKSLSFDLSYIGTNISKSDVTASFDEGENGTVFVYSNDAHRAAKGVVVGTVGVSF